MKPLLQKQIEIIIELIEKLRELLRLKKKDFIAFALAIKKRESGNNYKIVNVYGYLGAYQFGMARLCDLGYTERKAGKTGFNNKSFVWKRGYSQEYFLDNPDFQDRVFKKHILNLVERIEKRYSHYLGHKVNGIDITLSGCVAGVHLTGMGGLKKFFQGRNNSDAFGTRITEYIKKFEGYNIYA